MNDEKTPILLIYTGRRVFSDGSIAYEYQNEHGKALTFKKLKLRGGGVIGGCYQFNAENSKNGGISVYNAKAGEDRPVYKGIEASPADVSRWQVLDAAAQAIIDERRRESRAKSEPIRALEPIRLEYARARTKTERAAILAAVIGYITGK